MPRTETAGYKFTQTRTRGKEKMKRIEDESDWEIKKSRFFRHCRLEGGLQP